MFEKEPATKALFAGVNVDNPDSAEFTAHCVRVSGGLDTIINLFFDTPTLEQELHHLGVQHKSYEGMKPEYFTVRVLFYTTAAVSTFLFFFHRSN